MAYVISISNGKGGVAKTTTSIALGSSLAQIGKRVLLIDLDHNASLTLGFGSIPKQAMSFSKDLFTSLQTLPLHGLKTDHENLKIIPSNGDMCSLEERLVSINNSAMLLRRSLNLLTADTYDFIIIDCPASLGLLTVNALTASDLLIIPTQAEFFSAYALQAMFSMIKNIRRENNPSLQYRILITLLDLRLRDHRNILFQLQKHLGDSIYKTMIQIDTRFRESQTQGIPITYAIPNSRGAQQYKELAYEITNGLSEGNGHHPEQVLNSTFIERKELPNQAEYKTVEPMLNNNQEANTLYSHKPVRRDIKTEYHPQFDDVPLTESRQANQQNSCRSCPFLGGVDDPQTALSYPSTWNKCHRSKPALSPSYNHQETYCLTGEHSTCAMQKDKSQTSLPPEIRSPLDRSELLQYFKSWLVTRIR